MPTDDPPQLCLVCGAETEEEDWEYCSRKCGVEEALKRLTAAEISSPMILAVARAPSPVSKPEGFSHGATAPLAVVNEALPLGHRNHADSHIDVYEDHSPLTFERPPLRDNSIMSRQNDRGPGCVNRWDLFKEQPLRATETGTHGGLSRESRGFITGSTPNNSLGHRTRFAGGSSMPLPQHAPLLSRLVTLSLKIFHRRKVVKPQFSLPRVVNIFPLDPSDISSSSPCSSTSAPITNNPSLSAVSFPAVRHAPLDVPTSPTSSVSSFKVCSEEKPAASDTDSDIRFVFTGRGERRGTTTDTRCTIPLSPEPVPLTEAMLHGVTPPPVPPENCRYWNAVTEHSCPVLTPGQHVYLDPQEGWSETAIFDENLGLRRAAR